MNYGSLRRSGVVGMGRVVSVLLVFLVFSYLSQGVSAQETYSAGQMWGTQPSGVAVPGALESAAAHTQQGIIAGQVNAADAGFLFTTGSGQSLTIQSIGSQTVVSSTINGNDITSDIVADQDSTNSGDVTNDGTINTSN